MHVLAPPPEGPVPVVARRLTDHDAPLQRRLRVGAACAVVAALGLVAGLRLGAGVPVGSLTRDPAVLTGAPFYLGMLSHVGVLGWCAAAAVCFFAASVLRGDVRTRRFLQEAGTLTLALALDDLFLLHEEALPVYAGIPEAFVVGAYGAAAAILLVRFRDVVARTDVGLLLVALGLLGGSALLDVVPEALAGERTVGDVAPGLVDAYLLLEDGAKFAGIVCWLAYLVGVGYNALQPSRRPQPV